MIISHFLKLSLSWAVPVMKPGNAQQVATADLVQPRGFAARLSQAAVHKLGRS
jgi:hypothetical protein